MFGWVGTRQRAVAGDGIIADRGDGFQGHGAGAPDGPFVILLMQTAC